MTALFFFLLAYSEDARFLGCQSMSTCIHLPTLSSTAVHSYSGSRTLDEIPEEEGLSSSETSVTTYHSTRGHIPEDLNVHQYGGDICKPRILSVPFTNKQLHFMQSVASQRFCVGMTVLVTSQSNCVGPACLQASP
jgi:hypothetical protein